MALPQDAWALPGMQQRGRHVPRRHLFVTQHMLDSAAQGEGSTRRESLGEEIKLLGTG